MYWVCNAINCQTANLFAIYTRGKTKTLLQTLNRPKDKILALGINSLLRIFNPDKSVFENSKDGIRWMINSEVAGLKHQRVLTEIEYLRIGKGHGVYDRRSNLEF